MLKLPSLFLSAMLLTLPTSESSSSSLLLPLVLLLLLLLPFFFFFFFGLGWGLSSGEGAVQKGETRFLHLREERRETRQKREERVRMREYIEL